MKVEFLEIGQVDDKKLKFAVIGAMFQDEWVFVKHKQRDTWEIPGGHREIDEDIDDTAKRELFEETGAKTFEIKPVCNTRVIRGDGSNVCLILKIIRGDADKGTGTCLETKDMIQFCRGDIICQDKHGKGVKQEFITLW